MQQREILILNKNVDYHKLLKKGFNPRVGEENILAKECFTAFGCIDYMMIIDYETKDIFISLCKKGAPYYTYPLNTESYEFHKFKKYIPKRFLENVGSQQ